MTEFVLQDENGYVLEDYKQMAMGEVEEEQMLEEAVEATEED